MQGITSTGLSTVIDLSKRNLDLARVPSSGVQDSRVQQDIGSENLIALDKSSTQARVQPDPRALSSMLDKVNREMEVNNSSLRFKTDESSGRMVVAIYDANTEELIRQIPSEEALATAKQLSEFMSRAKSDASSDGMLGVLLNKQA